MRGVSTRVGTGLHGSIFGRVQTDAEEAAAATEAYDEDPEDDCTGSAHTTTTCVIVAASRVAIVATIGVGVTIGMVVGAWVTVDGDVGRSSISSQVACRIVVRVTLASAV